MPLGFGALSGGKHRLLRYYRSKLIHEPSLFGTRISKLKARSPVMGDTGIFKTSHQVWQRANIMAAANFMREQLALNPADRRVMSLYEGLLEVLDPSRRTLRVQRELAAVSLAAAPVKMERRARERRLGDRRQVNLGPPPSGERRSGIDRRTGQDRRIKR
jgi:hypothetical protein